MKRDVNFVVVGLGFNLTYVPIAEPFAKRVTEEEMRNREVQEEEIESLVA